MTNPIETVATLEAIEEIEGTQESEGNGFWLIFGPLIGIFLLFAVLEKFGFAPGEVWSFIKLLFFPSTWHYQMGYEFPHWDRSAALIATAVGYIAINLGVLVVVESLAGFLDNKKNILMKIMSLFVTIINKTIKFLFAVNFVLMIVLALYHLTAGTFLWLW
jgi:hypothetical protein